MPKIKLGNVEIDENSCDDIINDLISIITLDIIRIKGLAKSNALTDDTRNILVKYVRSIRDLKLLLDNDASSEDDALLDAVEDL